MIGLAGNGVKPKSHEKADPMSLHGQTASDIAKHVGALNGSSERPVYRYYNEYKASEQYDGEGRGKFNMDDRGAHQRDWILNEGDYLGKFVKNMQQDRLLSVDRQAKFVNDKLFRDEDGRGSEDVEGGISYNWRGSEDVSLEGESANVRASVERVRDCKDHSPGLVFLNYGKSKEGYWGYAHFHYQQRNVRAAYRQIYPQFQILHEVDHSSGHGKSQEGGLNVNNMGSGYGGKQHRLRDSKVTAGCLGSGEAKMWKSQLGEWSAVEVEGWEAVDCNKLREGDVQSFVFGPNDPPPFYKPSADKDDKEEVKARIRKKKKQMATVVVEGYVGKPKGMQQVLWERGLYVRGMVKDINVKKDSKQRGLGLSMSHVLSQCEDFAAEASAFQRFITDGGDILATSPKGHPELAGVGIEYIAGVAVSLGLGGTMIV